MSDSIALGDTVRETITGFTGVVVHHTTWLNGCRRVGIQPTQLGENKKPVDICIFDVEQCQLLGKAPVPQGLPPRVIGLGDKVRDKITGFTGIVTAVTDWYCSSTRANVQPQELSKDGTPIETHGFDLERLERLEAAVPPSRKPTGGDRPNVASRPEITR